MNVQPLHASPPPVSAKFFHLLSVEPVQYSILSSYFFLWLPSSLESDLYCLNSKVVYIWCFVLPYNLHVWQELMFLAQPWLVPQIFFLLHCWYHQDTWSCRHNLPHTFSHKYGIMCLANNFCCRVHYWNVNIASVNHYHCVVHLYLLYHGN